MQTPPSLGDVRDMLAFAVWVYAFGEHLGAPWGRSSASSLTHGVDMLAVSPSTLAATLHLTNTFPGATVDTYLDDAANGLQAAVVVCPDTRRIVVAFRGSDEGRDWLHNACAVQTRLEGRVRVHAGFQRLVASHGAELDRRLDDLLGQYPGFSVACTGHSLGGALATLFGYRTASRLTSSTPVAVTTFGSPRVGNFAFRAACDGCAHLTVLRVTHGRDAVTALPALHYFHVGSRVLHLENPAACTWFENYQYGRWQYSVLRCWSARDHATARYWAALVRAADQA